MFIIARKFNNITIYSPFIMIYRIIITTILDIKYNILYISS